MYDLDEENWTNISCLFSFKWFYSDRLICCAMLCISQSFLHQFLHPLLSQLRQYPHHNQLKHRIRDMLIQILVTPDVQFYLDIVSPQTLAVSAEKSPTCSWRDQREQGLSASTFDMYHLGCRRERWCRWRQAKIWKQGLTGLSQDLGK